MSNLCLKILLDSLLEFQRLLPIRSYQRFLVKLWLFCLKLFHDASVERSRLAAVMKVSLAGDASVSGYIRRNIVLAALTSK